MQWFFDANSQDGQISNPKAHYDNRNATGNILHEFDSADLMHSNIIVSQMNTRNQMRLGKLYDVMNC